MAAISFRGVDRIERLRNTLIQRHTAHNLTPCSQWDCNHAPELCRTCAQHAPRSAEAGEPEARRNREKRNYEGGGGRGITIRRSSTSMEAAAAMEEGAPYRRNEDSSSILPRGKERRTSVEI